MTATILCETQYDEVWWTCRQGVPTASEFDKIITPVNADLSKSADAYACQLIGDAADPHYLHRVMGDTFATSAMRTGMVMEPAARAWCEAFIGQVRQTGILLDESGRFGASPDGIFPAEDAGLELKSPLPGTHVEYLLAGVLPPKYRPQVHGHLIVGGFARVEFVSFVPGLPVFRVTVEPDNYTEKLKSALESFWARLEEIRKIVGVDRKPGVR